MTISGAKDYDDAHIRVKTLPLSISTDEAATAIDNVVDLLPSQPIGAVIFSNGTDNPTTGDDTNLHYDDTNNRLGIGTNTPDARLTVDGSQTIHNGDLTLDGGAVNVYHLNASGGVQIVHPVNAGYVRVISINQPSALISIRDGNTDSTGGGFSRPGNNTGELKIFSDRATFGSTPQSSISFYTNGVLKMNISDEGYITFPQGLSNFADDTAAATGGIPINGLYRNGSVVMIRVS